MTPKLLKATLPLTVALSLAAGFATAEEPKTELGRWMKPNMGAPLAGQDFDALKSSLGLVASKPPPGNYPKWATYAKDGQTAAANKDIKGVKASCKSCHDDYRKAYQDEFPDKKRPFP